MSIIDFFIGNLTVFLWANQGRMFVESGIKYRVHSLNVFISLLLFSSSLMLKSAMWKKI